VGGNSEVGVDVEVSVCVADGSRVFVSEGASVRVCVSVGTGVSEEVAVDVGVDEFSKVAELVSVIAGVVVSVGGILVLVFVNVSDGSIVVGLGVGVEVSVGFAQRAISCGNEAMICCGKSGLR